MKVAISLPDDLFKRAESFASDNKMSRSALYAVALEKYVQSHEEDEITAQLNEAHENDSHETYSSLKRLRDHSIKLYDKW